MVRGLSVFHYMAKEFGDGIYHRDPHKYICIIYLSLDAPLDSGTEVCGDDQVRDTLNTSAVIRRKESFHQDPFNWINRYRYDRVKNSQVLNAAYNDQQGLTAAFNLHVLQVLNNRLNANFMLDRFEHSACYNSDQQQIEMRVVAKSPQTIQVQRLSADFKMQRHEEIQTEISRKFTTDTMRDLLSKAKFNVVQTFSSPDEYFSLGLACLA